MNRRLSIKCRTLIVTALLGVGTVVYAQENYPNRSVEMVVGWPVGGGTDLVARVYAEVAKPWFPQPIVVVNKPGAIGSIGLSYVANAPANGYRILMATPEALMAPLLGIGSSENTIEDFVPVARINRDPGAITVRTDSPWNTLEEFLAHVRANPDRVTVSTSGAGAIPDLAAMAIEEVTGLKFSRIPYQGEAPAMQALLTGQVDATVISPSPLSQFVKTGQFRVLGVTASTRIEEFPDVPTFKERGMDVAVETWRGLLLPKGTPEPIIAQWRELTQKVSSAPKYLETLKAQNVNVIYEDSETFAKVLQENSATFARLVSRLKAERP